MCDQSPVVLLFNVLLSALNICFQLRCGLSSSSVLCYFIVTVGLKLLPVKARMTNPTEDLAVVSEMGLNTSRLEK